MVVTLVKALVNQRIAGGPRWWEQRQDVYHAPTNAELFQKRLRQMAPPEVRINGSDPVARWKGTPRAWRNLANDVGNLSLLRS